MNREDILFPVGALVEIAVRGVEKGLLGAEILPIVLQALRSGHATTPVPASVLNVLPELPIFPKPSQEPSTWSLDQTRWRPVVAQSLAALIAHHEQPALFWEGTIEAGRLLRPVNWASREASELLVFYQLSQGAPLPSDLEQTLRGQFDFSGSMSDVPLLPVGITLSSIGYGVMQLCRHASARSLQKVTPLLRRLRRLLEQDPLPFWLEIPLAELPPLFRAGCADIVCLFTPEQSTTHIELTPVRTAIHRVLLEGTMTLERFAAAERMEMVRDLGYALHNHPSLLINAQLSHYQLFLRSKALIEALSMEETDLLAAISALARFEES